MTTARPVLQLGLCGQFANNDGSSWDPMHEVVINRLQQTLNQFQQRPSLAERCSRYVQPLLFVFRLEDHGHAIVNRPHKVIG